MPISSQLSRICGLLPNECYDVTSGVVIVHPSEKEKKTCWRMSMIQLQHAAFMCRWLTPVRTMCVHLIIGNAYSWHGFSLNHRRSRNATHVPTGIAYIHILTHNISMSQKTTDLLSVLQMPPPHPALKKLIIGFPCHHFIILSSLLVSVEL